MEKIILVQTFFSLFSGFGWVRWEWGRNEHPNHAKEPTFVANDQHSVMIRVAK
jgi:hypothetical protein